MKQLEIDLASPKTVVVLHPKKMVHPLCVCGEPLLQVEQLKYFGVLFFSIRLTDGWVQLLQ